MIVRPRWFRWMVAVLACGFVAADCTKDAASPGGSVREPAPAESTGRRSEGQTASSTEQATNTHDPAHPPIDCPLREHGIDPSHMRPFEDVERYIAFLEREDRAAWQKPDEVVAALGLTGRETVVDLGAGSGYFAFRFAAALPRGRVFAADIVPEMIRHIHHEAMTSGIPNIEARLITAADPSVPAGADLVFVCDVLHHVTDRPTWLRKIAGAMSPGSRLALIEFKEGDLPEGPPEGTKIPRDELVKLVTDAGLVLSSEHAGLLPYQTFLVFRKP